MLSPLILETEQFLKVSGLCTDGGVTEGHGISIKEGEIGAVQVFHATLGVGNVTAAMRTEHLLATYAPDVVALTGMAGAVKDADLGDVVVATKVYAYEPGKDGQAWQPRVEVGNPHGALNSAARIAAGADAWRALARVPEEIRVLEKPIASGEKVLANPDSETFQHIRLHYGDAVAVEMEGHGVLAAAQVRGTPAIVIRGISDRVYIKGDKSPGGDERWQPMAARHAAALLVETLRTYGENK